MVIDDIQSCSEREPRSTGVADWGGSEEVHRGLQQAVRGQLCQLIEDNAWGEEGAIEPVLSTGHSR